MSRLKSSVSLALAGCCLLFSTVVSQVVNIQLPEILGVFIGDTISLGSLENITRNSYFSNNTADCIAKFDDSSVGSIAFRMTDLLAENTTRVYPAYAVATVGNVLGSHRFTISCKAKPINVDYLASGRIEVTSPSAQALYGFKNLTMFVDVSFQNDTRNLVKGLGYFPLSVGEANMRKLTTEGSDEYFKNGLVSPVSPAVFYDTDGVTKLASFSIIGIQQGCLSAVAHPMLSSDECVIAMKDNKTAVLFNYTGADGFIVPKLVKSRERVIQTEDGFGFGGCFTVMKYTTKPETLVYCWFFNPSTKKTKIVDTKDTNKLTEVQVGYRIVEQQNTDGFGNSIICFLIDELQNKPYKVGCISPQNGLANLSIFNELGQTATSSLNVTTNANSLCTAVVTNLSGNTGPFREMSAFATCNNSAFSGYLTLDPDIPKVAGGFVLNLSAPLRSKDEVVKLPSTTTATGFICKFDNELAYFASVNGNTEIHFQGTNSLNRGRLLRTPLGLTGAVAIISTLCSKQLAAIILEHNSIRYIMTVAPPRDFAASLLTRIPIFEKISSTANAYDATDDIMSGFIYNSNQFGKTLQLSDVSIFIGMGYLLDIYNPAVTGAGEYKVKINQKPEFGQTTSFDAFLRLFDSSPQLTQRADVTSMPANVVDDLQKYYSLSGNFSNIWIDNSTVFSFTPLIATTALNTTAFDKGHKPIFVLGNEYLVDLQNKIFANEKDDMRAAIPSDIVPNATFIGTVDNPTGYQMAVIASALEKMLQVVYFNNKSQKVEVSAPLNFTYGVVPGGCFHSYNSKGEPSIAVMVKNPNDTSTSSYVNIRYEYDAATGNLTKPSVEPVDHTFKKATTNSKAFGNYIVQLGPEESSKGALAATCQVLTIIGNNIRSAMIYPVCALPEFPEVKHYILSANKTGNTLRLEVIATAAHPELGFGEVVSLEADIFDGANFRPNRDIVWKTTSLRKFQKFVGHVVSVQRKGNEELILGLRRQPKSLADDTNGLPPTFVLSFFKTDPTTPYHQFEETNADFGAAFEYKNNWFISMFNTTSEELKTSVVNYAPPTLKLLPGSTADMIAGQTITFNKGTSKEIRRPMKAVVPPPPPSPIIPAPTPAASSSNPWIIVLVSIAAVGIVGGVAYYYFFYRRETIRRESDLNANNTSRITAEH